jgi:hypothetical protein
VNPHGLGRRSALYGAPLWQHDGTSEVPPKLAALADGAAAKEKPRCCERGPGVWEVVRYSNNSNVSA